MNYINEPSDNLFIKNINGALWLKTLNHYPKTIQHMKLLVSIVDKIGIFENMDLAKTCNMDSNKLNILYAILRITNKLFNKYLEHVTEKIFCNNFKKIFFCTNVTHYDLFFDQLTQDVDHFICYFIKRNFPKMEKEHVKNELFDYLSFTFKKRFYENIMKKLSYDVKNDFFKKNELLFENIINDFICYTRETLTETHNTMKIFLVKIFDTKCSNQVLNDITNSLKIHIDLDTLFKENCIEIDIYCEQKIDDEDNISTKAIMINVKKINDVLKNTNLQIYHDNMYGTHNILQSFINHNFVNNNEDLIKIIVFMLKKYSKEKKLIDKKNDVTIENYFVTNMINSCFSSLNHFCDYLVKNSELPKYGSIDIILRLISRFFNIKIKILDHELYIRKIDNAIGKNVKSVLIYKNEDEYYTLYSSNSIFIPIQNKPESIDKMVNDFENNNKKNTRNKNHTINV